MVKKSTSSNKFRNEELQAAILPIDKKKRMVTTGVIEPDITTFYTILGKHDKLNSSDEPIVDKSSKDIYAKKTVKDGDVKYYLKIDGQGKLYNPIGMFANERANVHIKNLKGASNKNFVEVRQKIFEYYVKFLKTKNKAWLQNAERELI